MNEPSTTQPPPPTVTDPSNGGTVLDLTDADKAAIVAAFEDWTEFSGNCTLIPSLKAATAASTGVEWAFGELKPPAGCTTVHDNTTVDIVKSGIYVNHPPLDAGVFEKVPGGEWTMNSHESDPFPCPDDLEVQSRTPGYGTAYLPTSIVTALGLTYATNCNQPYTPR